MKKTKRKYLKKTMKKRRIKKTRRGGMLQRMRPVGKTLLTATADILTEISKDQIKNIPAKKDAISKYKKYKDTEEYNTKNISRYLKNKYKINENINDENVNNENVSNKFKY